MKTEYGTDTERQRTIIIPERLDLDPGDDPQDRHGIKLGSVIIDRDGVVHLKDLVSREPHGGTAADVMRSVPIIPETMRLDQALAEFRRQRTQLAIVVDEFGGTAGLITIEDIIEELIGDVQDEFDSETPQFVQEPNGSVLIDGLATLDALRERLSLTLEAEPYDTVGGLVFGRLGRVAKVGDAVQSEGWRFEVTAVDGRRVARVRGRRSAMPS